MINLRMEEKLKSGEAVDVNVVGKPHPEEEHVWILPELIEGMDYCDAEDEAWIYCIGRHIQTGEIRAARDGRYYKNKMYECLFLR